jgi:hypothetical protein
MVVSAGETDRELPWTQLAQKLGVCDMTNIIF